MNDKTTGVQPGPGGGVKRRHDGNCICQRCWLGLLARRDGPESIPAYAGVLRCYERQLTQVGAERIVRRKAGEVA